MRIFSYNVNGIRSAQNKGFDEWLTQTNPDIICFQEIKANESDIPESIRLHPEYHSFWYPAQKKGYSGVGIMTKIKPENVSYGCGIPEYDYEGRVLRVDYKDFTLLSCYFPSGTTGDERQVFKEKFLEDFLVYIQNLKTSGVKLIITGDVNICHKPIDIHNPVSNKNSSGFLPQEREWFTRFLDLGFVDGFRKVNQEPHHYTWWSFRSGARSKNLGWRIDYHLVDAGLEDKIQDYRIHSDVYFSDHCPVELIVNF